MQEMAGKMAAMNESIKEAAEVQQGAIESLSEQIKIDLAAKGARLEKKLK